MTAPQNTIASGSVPSVYKVEWSRRVKITSAAGLLLYTALIFLPLLSMTLLWISLPALAVLLNDLRNAPRSIELHDDQLLMRGFIGSRRIPLADVKDVILMPSPDMSWCLFGSRGFMGYCGTYRTRAFGRIKAYVGCQPQSFLVQLKGREDMLLSCADASSIVAELKRRIS